MIIFQKEVENKMSPSKYACELQISEMDSLPLTEIVEIHYQSFQLASIKIIILAIISAVHLTFAHGWCFCAFVFINLVLRVLPGTIRLTDLFFFFKA